LDRGDGQVKYASLRILFEEFNKRMELLREEGKVQELIDVDGA
jgi:hypothetical protein